MASILDSKRALYGFERANQNVDEIATSFCRLSPANVQKFRFFFFFWFSDLPDGRKCFRLSNGFSRYRCRLLRLIRRVRPGRFYFYFFFHRNIKRRTPLLSDRSEYAGTEPTVNQRTTPNCPETVASTGR